MDEHDTADAARRIIDAAARIAAKHGATLNAYETLSHRARADRGRDAVN